MIVLLGASCSGKTTLFNSLCEQSIWNKHPEIVCVKEYTTRPPRHHEMDNSDDGGYHYISNEEYFDLLHSGKFASNFEVPVHESYWYYGILKEEVQKNHLICTNPTSFRQLLKYTDDICSIFLEVEQRERLIRMLSRGDNISEAYRRSVHDEGHFSGLKKTVSNILEDEPPEQVLKSAMKIIHDYLEGSDND